jgi:acyl-[acyl-carrier-protein]-phospholipid O-acyltransferase / long-chain-fatty-acid--[acyl-carrier-protein] ligase
MMEKSLENEPQGKGWLGFWSLVILQMQSAFTEKIVQFTLIALGGVVVSEWLIPVSAGLNVPTLPGLLIVLPMVLFAPTAGWVSDRFSKRKVILGAASAQLVVLVGICLAVALRNMPLALMGAFALAVLGAFLSPAKIGINKELLGAEHLGFAVGIQQMTVIFAMVCGQILASWLFDQRLGGVEHVWQAFYGPLLMLTAASASALLLALVIPPVAARGGPEFTLKLTLSHFIHLADLWRDLPMRRASLGVAFFWGFAVYVHLWAAKLARSLTGGFEELGGQTTTLIAAVSFGLVVGSGVAALLLRKRIELGWVPLASLTMTVVAVSMAFMTPVGWTLLVALGALAFSGAIYLVPLAAWMQDQYPAERRGRLQSAVNFQNCIAGISAVLVIHSFEWGAKALGISTALLFQIEIGFIGIVCGFVTWSILRLLPGNFIRLVGGAMIRSIYRIDVVNPERIPSKSGALLLPNHVTFADGLFISAACPRPVRFVMDEAFMAHRAIRFFVSIFDTVTIRRDQPREAIRVVIDALKKGDLVCLFPEGQLSRTGTLNELRRGFELIAKKAGHPLIPIWCDGSWGSIFSFERGSFFWKWPYRVPYGMTVAFGREIRSADGDLETVRHGLLAASAAAVGHRFEDSIWHTRLPKGERAVTRKYTAHHESTRRRIWVNGHQIGQVNGLQRHQPFHVLRGDTTLSALLGVLLTFPELFGAVCKTHDAINGHLAGAWVGGDLMRRELAHTQLSAELVFYDFGESALAPIFRAGLLHCPCLAVDGMVIAMSMPHPLKPMDGSEEQIGHKLGTWGKLLPGWFLDSSDRGALSAFGPAAPEKGLALPVGSFLDAEGFLSRGIVS